MRHTALKMWHIRNIKIAASLFPEVVYDSDFSRIVIERFPLPDGFKKNYTELVIKWQGIHGDIFNIVPDNFYVDKDIKLRDGDTPSHIYKNEPFNDRWPDYARVSWHLKTWKPSADVISGHNIMTILEGLYSFFKNAAS